MDKKNIPETLIKYYACNNNSCDALLKSYLWISHPLQFNDPFDCSEKLWELSNFSSDAIVKYMVPGVQFIFKRCKSNEDRRTRFINLMAPGIICLNKYNQNIEDVLWGYYTNQEGFAVEFESEILMNKWNIKPKSVNYEPSIDILDKFELQNYKHNFNKWALIKKRIWNQENEWRFLFTDCNSYNPILKVGDKKVRQKEYDVNSIKNVILGYRFFPQTDCVNINDRTENYIFNDDINTNYSFKILKFLFENTGIPLKKVALNENCTLMNQRIYIKEINDNQVTIVYE